MVAVVVIANILYLARGALFPFIISIVLAQLLYQVVVFLEERLPTRHRMPGVTRVVSILTIYVAFAAVVAGILYVTIPPLFAESQELSRPSRSCTNARGPRLKAGPATTRSEYPLSCGLRLRRLSQRAAMCWRTRLGASSSER